MSLAAELERAIREHEEWYKGRGPRWCVRLEPPTEGIYLRLPQGPAAVIACLYDMRRAFGDLLQVEGRPDLAYLPTAPLEHIVAPECSMPEVMANLRLSGLHGSYYKSPEVDVEFMPKEEQLKQERKEYRF